MKADADELWAAIEHAREGASDEHEVAENLQALLQQRSLEQIYAFLEQQARLMEQSYTNALWGAAYLINGGCSDDGFDYFRGWLLAQGRTVWQQALENPDALANVLAELDDPEDLECEDMINAAVWAYKKLAGDYPDGPMTNLPPLGEGWDFDDEDEMKRRYPALWALTAD